MNSTNLSFIIIGSIAGSVLCCLCSFKYYYEKKEKFQ